MNLDEKNLEKFKRRFEAMHNKKHRMPRFGN